MSTIKRGVSLYSYQDETFLGKMTLEDCIRTSVGFGARGIEVVSEQSFFDYPAALPDAVYDDWQRMMAQYDAVPVCHDFFLDYKKYKGRVMSFDEQVASCKIDIEHAARLGCSYTRALVSIAPEVLVACAEHAERRNVRVLLEVHAPLHFDHPWIVRHAEAYDRSGSAHLGFLPDMGMFVHRFPPVWKARFLRRGVAPAIADYIESAYNDRVLGEYVIQSVREMGGNDAAMGMATELRHNAAFEPRRMLDFMARIYHVHGKFYDMTPDLVELAIPYDEIVAVLKQGGYDGYICSEYEGNRWVEDAQVVDSVEQVRRHQAMLAALIAAPSGSTASH